MRKMHGLALWPLLWSAGALVAQPGKAQLLQAWRTSGKSGVPSTDNVQKVRCSQTGDPTEWECIFEQRAASGWIRMETAVALDGSRWLLIDDVHRQTARRLKDQEDPEACVQGLQRDRTRPLSDYSKAGGKPVKAEDGEMRDEYDLTNGRPNPYAERFQQAAATSVVIEPELFALFPSAEAVNEALRLLVKAGQKARRVQAASGSTDKHAKAS